MRDERATYSRHADQRQGRRLRHNRDHVLRSWDDGVVVKVGIGNDLIGADDTVVD